MSVSSAVSSQPSTQEAPKYLISTDNLKRMRVVAGAVGAVFAYKYCPGAALLGTALALFFDATSEKSPIAVEQTEKQTRQNYIVGTGLSLLTTYVMGPRSDVLSLVKGAYAYVHLKTLAKDVAELKQD
jgi:hypothetical protein